MNDNLIALERRTRALERYNENINVAGAPYKSIVADFMLLPYLRGLWTFTSRDESDNVRDFGGQDRTLTNNNGAPLNELANNNMWYTEFNGTTQYYSRADEAGLDITGNLTMGGWFRFDAASTLSFLMGKASTSNLSYWFSRTATNVIQANVSSNGTTQTSVDSGTVTTSQWYFVVMRYTPSTELAVFLNNTKTTNTTSIPASIYSGSGTFTIGAYVTGPAQYLDGSAALCFLTASPMSDASIQNLYFRTRPLFVVFT